MILQTRLSRTDYEILRNHLGEGILPTWENSWQAVLRERGVAVDALHRRGPQGENSIPVWFTEEWGFKQLSQQIQEAIKSGRLEMSERDGVLVYKGGQLRVKFCLDGFTVDNFNHNAGAKYVAVGTQVPHLEWHTQSCTKPALCVVAGWAVAAVAVGETKRQPRLRASPARATQG